MTRIQDRFWNWATGSAVRFGGCLLAVHAIVTTAARKRDHG